MMYEPLIRMIRINRPVISAKLVIVLGKTSFFEKLTYLELLEVNKKLFSNLEKYLHSGNPQDWCDFINVLSLDWYKQGATLVQTIGYFEHAFILLEQLVEQELAKPSQKVLRGKSLLRLNGLLTMAQVSLTITYAKNQPVSTRAVIAC